jgi:hypothetical protein
VVKKYVLKLAAEERGELQQLVKKVSVRRFASLTAVV